MWMLLQAAQAAVQSAVNSSFHSVLHPVASTWVNCSQPPEKLGQILADLCVLAAVQARSLTPSENLCESRSERHPKRDWNPDCETA